MDTEILDVDIERLALACSYLDIEHVLINTANGTTSSEAEELDEELILQTGLPHLTIHMEIKEDVLSAFASWEGRLPVEAEGRVAEAIAKFNWDNLAPSLSFDFIENNKGEEEIVISANRAMAVGLGLSRNQLCALILNFFESFHSAQQFLESTFTEAVKWGSEDHE